MHQIIWHVPFVRHGHKTTLLGAQAGDGFLRLNAFLKMLAFLNFLVLPFELKVYNTVCVIVTSFLH